MGHFTVPNKHQRELMERNSIRDTGYSFAVILENDCVLVLKNHDTGDNVTIEKGDKTKREEQNEQI